MRSLNNRKVFMFTFLRSPAMTIGLAIFCMLFGAGNLIYPLKAGINCGDALIPAIIGFCMTAVIIPLLGLVSIILFNGDYRAFFYRLGNKTGAAVIALCMLLVGPFFASARLVTVSHGVLSPFLPSWVTPTLFSVIFCIGVFIATYSAKKFIALLSDIISPILIVSIGVIFIKGLLNSGTLPLNTDTAWNTFNDQALLGYSTLDLLGTILFGSVILNIIKQRMEQNNNYNLTALALTSLKGGIIGCTLLTVVYCQMIFLGAAYGKGMENTPITDLFSAISLKILGAQGGFFIALTVTLACFSTLMALAAVLAEYIHKEVTHQRVCFKSSLVITLAFTAFISQFGLDTISLYAGPIFITLYPALITLAIVNILYKLTGFSLTKIPFFITLAVSIYYNLESFKVFTAFLQ